MSAASGDRNEINPHDCCSTPEKVQSGNDAEIQPDNLHDRTSNRNPGPYPFFIGIAAALGVLGFFFSLLTLTSDWNNAKMQFEEYRWWIISLSVGLGIQATLFSFLRKQLQRTHMRTAQSSLAASGGMSTASMAACCAHYLVPLLPAMGLPFLSTAVASISEYQSAFFFLGVLSNLFGIGFMLRLMKRNGIIKIPISWTR